MPQGGILKKVKIGDRFGKWTAIEPLMIIRPVGQQWLFRCDCGLERPHFVTRLRAQVNKGNIPACMDCFLTKIRQEKAKTFIPYQFKKRRKTG